MNSIRLALSSQGATVFRTNVGKVKLSDGRWFDTGLPKGHSDLVAYKNGRAYFLEVKVKPNKPTDEQLAFLRAMKTKGCKGAVVYSVEDALKLITEDG